MFRWPGGLLEMRNFERLGVEHRKMDMLYSAKLKDLKLPPCERPTSLGDLSAWYIVLYSPVGLPWHVEALEWFLQQPPSFQWRIVGIFPTIKEANLACDIFEQKV